MRMGKRPQVRSKGDKGIIREKKSQFTKSLDCPNKALSLTRQVCGSCRRVALHLLTLTFVFINLDVDLSTQQIFLKHLVYIRLPVRPRAVVLNHGHFSPPGGNG